MKAGFIFFVVVLILGVIVGYYLHEAQDEKIRFERELYKELYYNELNKKIDQRNLYTNINNVSDVVVYERK